MVDIVDFASDIKSQTYTFNKIVKVNNFDLNIQLVSYKEDVCDIFSNWQTILQMLGKNNKSENIIKILYCLLSDCCFIKTIQNEKSILDLYDIGLEKFVRVGVVNEKNRIIKIRVFNVCDSFIVFDCKDMKNYKVYELNNLLELKSYYESNKINFDKIVKELNLRPFFMENIKNLKSNYKILSINRRRLDKCKYIESLSKYIKDQNVIEKKISNLQKYLANHK